jgi:hypothetical protein
MSIGTTGAYKKVYYHLPGDDPSSITIDIMEDVAKMIYVALTNMANDPNLIYLPEGTNCKFAPSVM